MDYCLLLACICAVNLAMAENDITECSVNEYFDTDSKECSPCTLCGASNTIIRVPCSPYADTVCGPFLEFDTFHQAPVINLLPADNETTKVLVTGSISSHGSFEATKTHGSVPVEMVTDERWYTLAMALVGVLSFVSLIIIIYITIYCFICRKNREEKELIYYPELCSSAPETPMVLTPRMTSRDRLKKHMITSYDDSGDNYGATSNRVVLLAGGVEPFLAPCELSTESDDNSGQTVSSSSTNYVYFKAPPHENV